MTPFLRFRVWLRTGSTRDRGLAGAAFVAFLALVGWFLVPVGDDGEAEVGANLPGASPVDGFDPASPAVTLDPATGEPVDPGAGPADPADPVGGGVDPGTGPGGGTDPGGGGGTDPGDGGGGTPVPQPSNCSNLGANDQGVTADEVFVVVSHIALAGGAANSTFGVRSPSEIRELVDAYTDAINDAGGVACRKLVTEVVPVNTLDPNDQRARCLEIAGMKPLLVVDLGGYLDPVARSCFPENQLPFQPSTQFNEAEIPANFPFFHSVAGTADRSFRNWLREVPERGWFTAANGFTKLGITFDSCNPQGRKVMLDGLAQLGISGNKISVFDFSHCNGLASPAETQAAVSQHRSANASHVFFGHNGADAQAYVRAASGIGFNPDYFTSDYGNNTQATLAAQFPAAYDGAIAITSTRAGERNSGVNNALVAECNKMLTDRGVRPSNSESDQNPLATCDQIRLFVEMANAAGPGLTRANLLPAMQKLGRFETAVLGDAQFDRPNKYTGGDFIRAIEFDAGCSCWKLLDRNTKPSG